MEMPRPTESHRRRHALDGFAIVQQYERRRGGSVTFCGHGVFGADAASGRFQMHRWDSMGSPVDVFTGGFDGDRLVLECAQGAGASRATFDLARAAKGRYSFLMEVSPDGAQWFPFMEGNYRRA